MLVRRINDVEHCFAELEKRMKKEWDDGIMTKDEYLFHRKTNFEVKRMVERLNDKDFYNITFYDQNNIKILYKHI